MKHTEYVEAKRSARRKAILTAAIAEARDKGFANIRQAAVAARAGVAKGSVTAAFGSMGQLCEDVLTVAVERRLLPIIAAGLAAGHPVARAAPAELRQASIAAIA